MASTIDKGAGKETGMRLPRHLSKGRAFFFTGIAFVLVLVSLGIFINTNQINAAQAHATATAQSEQRGTNVADHATNVANNATITSTLRLRYVSDTIGGNEKRETL